MTGIFARTALAVVCAASLWVVSMPGAARAADHRDAPTIKQTANLSADITDVYAFRSPADSTRLVVALNVNPRLPGEARSSYFSNDVQYLLHVTMCNGSPLELMTTFTGAGAAQLFSITGLPGGTITGIVDASNVTGAAGAIKAFCGGRDDPFFFDLDAFKHYLAGPYTPTNGLRRANDPSGFSATPVDFFKGSDIAAIVLEFPIAALGGCSATSGSIKAWAQTKKRVNASSAAPFLTNPVR